LLTTGLAAVLLSAYTLAFVAGLNWRLTYLWSTAPRFAEIAHLMRSSAPVREITEKHMLELFYIDTPAQRREIEAGISKLRQLGAPVYGPGK
jgi:hypothetical protein